MITPIIIHAVGPIYHDGNHNEVISINLYFYISKEEDLKNATLNSLKMAESLNLKDIAIPAISSGIFGFPKDLY